MSWDNDEKGFLDELARRPAARAPATFGEIWDSEWKRGGLDTIFGLGQPMRDAQADLTTAIERAAGKPIADVAREANVQPAPGALELDPDQLGQLVDRLPEDKRKAIDPLKDVRLNAAKKAQKIEADADDVASATYGLSGVGTSFLAGMARQAVDPVNVGAMVLTAPFGGSGSILTRIAIEGAANAASQALVEPIIEPARAELGLEAGWGRAAGNVAEAFAGGVALSGLFHGAAYGLRRIRGERPAADSASALKAADGTVTPPDSKSATDPVSGAPAAAMADAPAGPLAPVREIEQFVPEDLTAAALLAERDHVVDAMAPAQNADAVHAHAVAVSEAADRIDTTAALPAPAAAPPFRIADDIEAKLRNIGMAGDEARVNAAVFAARYETRAERLGIDAVDLYREANVLVARDGAEFAGAPALAQTSEKRIRNEFDDRRLTKRQAERELIERYDQFESLPPERRNYVQGMIDSLEATIARFDQDIPRGKPFSKSKVLPAGDRFAVRVVTDERHGAAETSKLFRIYRRPDGDLETLSKPSRTLRRPLGQVEVSQHPDGRWEVDMVEVSERHRGQGVATALYNAIQREIGQEMAPSGMLLPDGYSFWKARAPEKVKWHTEVFDHYYASPKKLASELAYQEGRDPEKAAYLRSRLDALPAEAKSPEAFATMFQNTPLERPLVWNLRDPDAAAATVAAVKKLFPERSGDFMSREGLDSGLTPELWARAQAAGFDGIEVHGKAGVKQTKFAFDGKGDVQGLVQVLKDGAVIRLFENADPSTFMHEAGHLWLFELGRDAARAGAPAQIKSDLDAVLKWLGVDSVDNLQTKHHEQWARGFEEYLREGKAPSLTLGRAFQQFKDWLTTIYKKLSDIGPDHVAINDDIRGVMDRLLATDDEIASRAMKPQAPRALRGRAAADPNTWSMFEFLARNGGLKPDQELSAILGGINPFVPGFGKLIRKSGKTLDDAFTSLKEAQYVIDPGEVEGRALTMDTNDLLRMIDEEARGNRQYIPGQEPAAKIDAGQFDHEVRSALHDELERNGYDKPDAVLENRVVEIMRREGGTDVLEALERAIMEDASRYDAIEAGRIKTADVADIPGWDVPDDTGAAPRDGAADPRQRGQAERADQGTRGADGEKPRDDGGPDRTSPVGDVALAADAQRALDDAGGDMEITLLNPDGSTRTLKASDALREVEDDARAAAELQACITGAVEDGS